MKLDNLQDALVLLSPEESEKINGGRHGADDPPGDDRGRGGHGADDPPGHG